jgi:hypothetical protein
MEYQQGSLDFSGVSSDGHFAGLAGPHALSVICLVEFK